MCAQAGGYNFSFQLPAFGGNAINTSYYLSLLDSQKRPKVTETEDSQIKTFAEDLERRLLTTLASDIVSKIFGDDATASGNFTVGELDVSYDTINGDVVVTLADGISTTQIVVPGV
jgi:curli production assembly/transport component CsgF|tara:strand:- start:2839 stop:3186 length:348 start_codon:yes stop_codon:yes gene_type:complete